jgi:hypothetical protein
MELESFKVANQTAGRLMAEGHHVFSPITATHPIAVACSLPSEWEYWEDYDRGFIEWCDELWVADFGDWKKSKGVSAEIRIAQELEKPVKFL